MQACRTLAACSRMHAEHGLMDRPARFPVQVEVVGLSVEGDLPPPFPV